MLDRIRDIHQDYHAKTSLVSQLIDSSIVPAKYEDFLYEVMIEAYQKVIGRDYSPIIKKVE